MVDAAWNNDAKSNVPEGSTYHNQNTKLIQTVLYDW